MAVLLHGYTPAAGIDMCFCATSSDVQIFWEGGTDHCSAYDVLYCTVCILSIAVSCSLGRGGLHERQHMYLPASHFLQ